MSDRKRRPGLFELLTGGLLPRDRTDVDFRPPPEQGRDVIAGWEEPPRVPGSNEDQVR
jgi:hypothetical protein